jgi:hypothetical protein
MKVKIIEYPCKGWCLGKEGEAARLALPEPGILVKFEGTCPHKAGAHVHGTTCFIENMLSIYEVVES